MNAFEVDLIITILLIIAFIPALIASNKRKSMALWYIYALAIFPVALIHSIIIKETVYCLCINTKNSKKTYRIYQPKEKWGIAEIKKNILDVIKYFTVKLLIGIMMAVCLYSIFRIYTPDSRSLMYLCYAFGASVSVASYINDKIGVSLIGLFTEEITFYVIQLIIISVICSIPLYFAYEYILSVFFSVYNKFWVFFCSVISFSAFVSLLVHFTKKRAFEPVKLFPDMLVNLPGYIVFAGIELALMSKTDLMYILAMPFRLLALEYGDEIGISYMYMSAIVHLCIFMILLGVDIRNKRCLIEVDEYRVKRNERLLSSSRKRILHRHIPKM